MIVMTTDHHHHHQVVKNNEVPAVGYWFNPTDKELAVDYLFHKVHGNPLPSTTAVKECDIYGESHAWKGLFEDMEEDTLYFFTRLKKKTEKGKRVDRTTDSGTWKGQQGDKEIFGPRWIKTQLLLHPQRGHSRNMLHMGDARVPVGRLLARPKQQLVRALQDQEDEEG
ncbi:hypothetical protein LWI28_007492 [Acer negundo]|uniref:NAC domain-containing protein n=1 Tax=Acer negundo TaxID=4023 RepID=A0AAD5IDI9_ACENE|nr:hypothetical protein LWI28_007492 [Acer negundo]